VVLVQIQPLGATSLAEANAVEPLIVLTGSLRVHVVLPTYTLSNFAMLYRLNMVSCSHCLCLLSNYGTTFPWIS
jgi:hypothetical protein